MRNLIPALALIVLSSSFSGCATLQSKEKLVELSQVDPTISQEIRYAGEHNFIGRPIRGYLQPKCYLTREAALALARAQAELRAQSLSLRLYDCYRPQRAVDDFVAWAKDLTDTKMKAEFYPKVDKNNLFRDGYIAEKSGHSRGSTVDLTLISAGEPLDMGTPYDFFDPLSHTENPTLSHQQKKNRHLLKSTLEKYGFKNLPEEWWHYTFKPEPFPDRYFDFEVK
jgi:D-alanyl-D-alanine dipeptidase